MVIKQSKINCFDIHNLPSDGYIVFPLSMSRLNAGQNPEDIYRFIELFEKKISTIGIDGVFLYTNGLYYNNTESALTVRKRTNQQMLNHKNQFLKLVLKKKKYIPQSMHFLPWDYVVLNSVKYQEFFQILLELRKNDKKFNELLVEGLGNREHNEANINFLIEEIVITHIIRQKYVEFPKTLVKKDSFRLIAYPGQYFKADLYQWKNKILPINNDRNPYGCAHYDLDKNILYDFNKLQL